MLRGCQKRVIHLRDVKSQLFDEAYFIIREQSETECPPSQNEMMKEVRRILGENMPQSEIERRAKIRSRLWISISFLLGVAVSWTLAMLFCI